MEASKKRIRRLWIDIAVAIVGTIVLALFLNMAQNNLSTRRQRDNSAVKLQIAQQRIAQYEADADVDAASSDDFIQAKIDSLAYFLEQNPDYDSMTGMGLQWGFREMYFFDGQNQMTFTNTFPVPDFSDTAVFGDLWSADKPVTVGSFRYFTAQRASGGRLIGAMNVSEELETLALRRSPGYALSNIKVGTDGFILAVGREDGVIAYHKDASLIGKSASEIGLDPAKAGPGYVGWLDLSGTNYYCEAGESGDYLLYALVGRDELNAGNTQVVGLALAVFIAVILLILIYAALIRRDMALNPQREPADVVQLGKNLYYNRTVGEKIKNVAVIGLLAILLLSFYTQSLAALMRQINISETKLDAVENILEKNNERVAELTDEYAREYTRRAENIAYTLNVDRSLIHDNRLAELAKKAQVSAIYVFDGEGKVEATNTNYKDFVLSDDPASQSYPFWAVVRGYQDSLVQAAQRDDSFAGNFLQYVGVKRLDAPGMVQLGLLPKRLAGRLNATELKSVLGNIAVENGGFLFAVSKADGTILSFPEEKYVGHSAADYGLTEAAYKDEYSGFQTVNGQPCFVTSRDQGSYFLMMAVPVSVIYATRVEMALIVTAAALVVILLLSLLMVLSRENGAEQVEESKAEETAERAERKRNFFVRLVAPGGRSRVVQTAASRWSGTGDAPWSERNPEQKLQKILGWLLTLAALAIVLVSVTQSGSYDSRSTVSYILSKRWEPTPNIFSLTYVFVVVVEILIVSGIARKAILIASSRFGARSETVGRLLDNFIKYCAVIGAAFYSLNFLGVDTNTLMTSAGILGLVVGLGANKLIGDILAGIFIVFEGEFRVGDIVTVGDWRGTVMEIGIRTTKIMSGGKDIKIFANSSISGVVNMTKQYSFAGIVIGIEYNESLERVEAVLQRELPIIKGNLPAIVAGPFYKGVTSLGDSSVNLSIVAQCREEDRMGLVNDLNRAVKLAFDRNNIGIPFPQIVVNEPAEHEQATRSEKRRAENFVEEQKELSKDIVAKDENAN